MANESSPNLLIFMTDQQRGDVVLPQHPCKTPTLDRFRERAVTFREAFCPSPHCCPSRATFFTGLMPSQHGVWNNVSVQNTLSRGLKPGVQLWSEQLKHLGYTNEFVGKWHVSFDTAPRDHGWNERLVTARPAKDGAPVMESTWESYQQHAEAFNNPGERQPGEIRRPGWTPYTHYGIHENPHGDEQVIAATEAALSEGFDDPWCLYCGPLGPHDPYRVPQRFLDLYRDVEVPLPPSFDDRMLDKPGLYRRTRSIFDQLSPDEHRDAIRHYWALCSYEDYLFGRVLEALSRSGQAERTVVIYCSDHGDYAGEHGLWTKGLPCFRGAYHVPLLIAGPGIVSGNQVDAKVSLADIAPTILELADAPVPQVLSGRSLMPWLRGETPAWRDALFTQSNGNEQYGIQRSVTTDRWKYVHNGYDFDELYDLENDPDELNNLAVDPLYSQVKLGLCRRMWRFAADHDDPCINPYIMTAMAPVGPAAGLDPELLSGW
jgi:choline-sulfatase